MEVRRCAVLGFLLIGSLVTEEFIEVVHFHETQPPDVLLSARSSPIDRDHTHDEQVAFVAVRTRKPSANRDGNLFWGEDDSAPFWSGNDSQQFWNEVVAPGYV